MTGHRSKFMLTVPQEFFDAVAEATDADFAGTYLPGAVLDGQVLHPWSLTGWGKMKDRWDFVQLLKARKITMVKPTALPGDGSRFTADELCRGFAKERAA